MKRDSAMFIDQTVDLNIAEIISHFGSAPETKDRTFLMFRDERGDLQQKSYEAYLHRSLDYAKIIQRVRVECGREDPDRFHVGFFMQNTPEVLFLFGGCAFTNSTLVGINNAQVGEKLATDITNADVDLLFVDDHVMPKTNNSFFNAVLQAHERFGLGDLYPSRIITRNSTPDGHPEDIQTIDDVLHETANDLFTGVPLQIEMPGVIIFTSGTTGAPKGIEVSWKKLHAIGQLVTNEILGYNQDDIGYVCMPLNHSNSIYINVIPALMNCARLFIRRRFSASGFVKDLEDSGATIWNCVGDPVKYVINVVGENADFSHLPLRTVCSTGTNPQNRVIFSQIFGLDIFSEVFGSTEIGGLAAVTPETPGYSVGRYIPGRDIRIVNEATQDECEFARVDEKGVIQNFAKAVGEITVSQKSLGDSAFTGYYKQPEASAAKVDADGYYHTGDLGASFEIGGQKYLMFLGRTGTDRLRTKGENFSTVFVEQIVMQYPGIANCAVIGVPFVDSTENDNPMIVIETHIPASFDVTKFIEFCKTELPAYALPGFVRVTTRLPKTETQKVKKSLLLRDFFKRTLEMDADQNDILYCIEKEGPEVFTTEDYQRLLGECTEPVVRNRFQVVTGCSDLFT
jgi:fatty-acyl-CoA synthase